MTLHTSPNDLEAWLGPRAIRASDNLKLPDPRKAAFARTQWEGVCSGRIVLVQADDGEGFGG